MLYRLISPMFSVSAFLFLRLSPSFGGLRSRGSEWVSEWFIEWVRISYYMLRCLFSVRVCFSLFLSTSQSIAKQSLPSRDSLYHSTIAQLGSCFSGVTVLVTEEMRWGEVSESRGVPPQGVDSRPPSFSLTRRPSNGIDVSAVVVVVVDANRG